MVSGPGPPNSPREAAAQTAAVNGNPVPDKDLRPSAQARPALRPTLPAAVGRSRYPLDSRRQDHLTSTPSVHIDTFGGFRAHVGARELPAVGPNNLRLSLLLLVAVERQLTRDQALALLWPERDVERGRHSLSQAAYRLRQEFGEEVLSVRGELVEVGPAVACDAAEFLAAAEQSRSDRALALYRGAFLAGTRLVDSVPFQEWVHQQRTRLARVHRKVRRNAIAARYAAGDPDGAFELTRGWAELDPYDDEAQHRLLTFLAEAGERAELLERYAEYEHTLRERGLDPLAETKALVDRVRHGAFPGGTESGGAAIPAVRAAPAPDAEDAGSTAAAVQRVADAPAANAPAPETAPGLRGLLSELRRRRVVRVGAAYAAVGFVVIQAADLILSALLMPHWTFTLLVVAILLGFPVALVLAWAFDLTPEGLRRAPVGRYRFSATTLLRGGTAALLVLVLLAVGVVLRSERPALADRGSAYDPARIAVLYFEDGSADGSLGPLANGLTADLIRELKAVPGLEVISIAGVRPYRGTSPPPDSIMRALEVGTIVSGRIEQSGDQLRVTAEIVNPATLQAQIVGPLTRPEAEQFELQAELATATAHRIRRALRMTLRPAELGAGTQVREAWHAVQLATEQREWALRLVQEHAGDSLAAAAALQELRAVDSLLARAEELDRRYALPVILRASLAADRARMLELLTQPLDLQALTQELRVGLQHAHRAVTRWPNRADALEKRGMLAQRLSRRLWGTEEAAQLRASAERDLQAAVAADSGLAGAWAELSELLQLKGDYVGAHSAARQALREDRFLEEAAVVINRVFNSALHLGWWQEAADWCAAGRAEFPEQHFFYACELLLLAFAEPAPADADRAWLLFDEAQARTPPKLKPERSVYRELEVAVVLARVAQRDSALAVLSRVESRLHGPDAAVSRPRTFYYQALVQLYGGDHDAALTLLEAYVLAMPEMKSYLARDLALRPLHAESRFRALVAAPTLPD
jgi:DNA-binding SARP family transcriptional activator/TolB-like protein